MLCIPVQLQNGLWMEWLYNIIWYMHQTWHSAPYCRDAHRLQVQGQYQDPSALPVAWFDNLSRRGAQWGTDDSEKYEKMKHQIFSEQRGN